MSHKANPTAIGIFVTGAIVIASLSLILIGSGQWLRSEQRFVLYFRADANGLDIGSDVRIGGVPIGRVETINIRIDPDTGTKIVPVVIAIDEEKFSRLAPSGTGKFDLSDKHVQEQIIDRGLRGRLKQSSYLTGKLFVELDVLPQEVGYTFTESKVSEFTQIPTVTATMDKLMQSISDSLDKISSLEINRLFQAVEDLVDTTEQRIADIDTKTINENLVETTQAIRSLVEDPELKSAISDFKTSMEQIKSASATLDQELGPIAESLNAAIAKAEASMEKIDIAAANVENFTDEDGPTALRLNEAIKEFSRAAKSVQELADYLKRNPDSVISGRE